MADSRLRIRLRGPTPRFLRAWATMRGVLRLYAEYITATLAVSFLFGPLAPMIWIAVLATFGLPVALLAVWGHSLDDELGWIGRGGR